MFMLVEEFLQNCLHGYVLDTWQIVLNISLIFSSFTFSIQILKTSLKTFFCVQVLLLRRRRLLRQRESDRQGEHEPGAGARAHRRLPGLRQRRGVGVLKVRAGRLRPVRD